MRHRNNRLRLNKKPDHARMLKRNLVTALILYEAIRTTKKQAHVIQPIIDKLITEAKKQSPHNAIRVVNKVVTDKNASRKMMEVLVARYKTRPSGFTRIVPAGARKGDGAAIVDMMLLDRPEATASSDKAPKTPKAPKGPKKAVKASSDSSAPSVPSKKQ